MRCMSRNRCCEEEHRTEICAVPKTLEWHRQYHEGQAKAKDRAMSVKARE